jgi:dolichol-phosphate mannosyltransferase
MNDAMIPPNATITLIIPALNEEEMITPTVQQILACVDGRFLDYEVLLVNDGSTDATGELMEHLAATNPRIRVFHHLRNLGLGSSYRLGIAEARHQYVMLLCGDGGMPASSLPAIFDRIGTADIVIPFVRNLRQIKTSVRFVISRAYTTLLNILFGLRLRYYNGLPVHRVDLVRAVEIKSDGFGFQGELLVKLLKSGCSFVQIGVDGAEKTKRSSALRLSSVINVAKTLTLLVWEVTSFDSRRVRALIDRPRPETSGAPGGPGGAPIV